MSDTKVLIVGGGFAGATCAKQLAKHDVDVILLDRNNYHQFQPLLYQVATAQIAAYDIARPLRSMFRHDRTVDIQRASAEAVDVDAMTVTTSPGTTISADYIVLAAGAQPNFFGTPGADEHTFPLYSLNDAERLRSHIFTALDATDADPTLVDRGALNFVIVGGGATGVETAGSLAELISGILPERYHRVSLAEAKIHLVELGDVLLAPFSDRAHKYAAERLEKDGVVLHLGVGVKEVKSDRVVLSDGSEILTKTVVWGGGEKAAEVMAKCGVTPGRGGRIDVAADLTVRGHDKVYALGDAANIPGPDGQSWPQLGSVAQQSGAWAADNILADIAGKDRKPFHYKDKGIMAMIGRNAAVAEMGPHRREIEGVIAFAAWLGVHAMLLSGVRNRADAFVAWGWDYFSKNRAEAIVDRPDASTIDWGDDEDDETPDLKT